MPKGKTTKAKARRHRPSVRRSRGELLPASFLNHLSRYLADFKHLSPQDRHDVAYLIWMEGTWRRKHALLPGQMTIHYRELMDRFGRNGFTRINAELRVFEIGEQWWPNEGATKGYRLTPEVATIKDQYLHKGYRRLTHLIQNDGKRMRTIPEAIAAKDQKDRTQTVWRNTNVVRRIPVDLPRLRLLYDRLERLYEDLTAGQGTGDLFLPDVDVEDVRWHYDSLGQFLRLCKTDVGGIGHVPIRYVVARTGRLFAEGISLQTLPKAIRKVALHGLWDYDIENCHFAIFRQMAARYGFEAASIAAYLRHKTATREGIADRVGITVPQVKVCLLAIMYGARDTTWHGAAIPLAIGGDAAVRLFADPIFTAILADIKEGRKVILAGHPKRRTTLLNSVALPIRVDEPAEERLAHLIQGVEAKALRAVQTEHPEDILLLMHDGWVSRKPLDRPRIEAVIQAATGYELRLSEEKIALPPDLELTILI